jgi:hypothetical protein
MRFSPQRFQPRGRDDEVPVSISGGFGRGAMALRPSAWRQKAFTGIQSLGHGVNNRVSILIDIT